LFGQEALELKSNVKLNLDDETAQEMINTEEEKEERRKTTY